MSQADTSADATSSATAALSELNLNPPFHDEATFKTWNNEGKHHRAPRGITYPKDGEPVSDVEQDLCAKVLENVKPELKDQIPEGMINRFVRGYAMRSFAGAPDKVERTALMLNLCLQWRAQQDVDTYVSKEIPRRSEWDDLWPQALSGEDQDGRVVWYSMWPGDIKSCMSTEEAHKLHIQDLLRLEKAKDKANLVMKADNKPILHHHVLVLDLSHEKGEMSRAMLKFMKDVTMHTLGFSLTQYFFPDVLEKAYVINTPFIFRALWSFAKLFMEAETADKYNLLSSDYLDQLKEGGIPLSSLPMCAGGTAQNPSGLVTKVLVPKEGKEEKVLSLPAEKGKVTVNWKIHKVKDSEPQFEVAIVLQNSNGNTTLRSATVSDDFNGTYDLEAPCEIAFIFKGAGKKAHASLSTDYTRRKVDSEVD